MNKKILSKIYNVFMGVYYKIIIIAVIVLFDLTVATPLLNEANTLMVIAGAGIYIISFPVIIFIIISIIKRIIKK